ncbi:hypothetical protein Sste5344_009764 [Sporothrix stenoceras]
MPDDTEDYRDPWPKEDWGLAKLRLQRSIPDPLRHTNIFKTAEQLQQALDLRFLPETIEVPFIPQLSDKQPPGSSSSLENVRICLAPGDSEECGFLVPTDYLRDKGTGAIIKTTVTRSKYDKERDTAEKQGRIKYADFLARKGNMNIDERLA